MSSPQDGGPAFPVPMFTRQADGQPMSAGEFFEGGNGMMLRDWFAGMALSGYAGRACMTAQDTMDQIRDGVFYEMADAMLAARERKEQP